MLLKLCKKMGVKLHSLSIMLFIIVVVVHFLSFQRMFCRSLNLGKWFSLCDMDRVVASNCSLYVSNACVVIFFTFCSIAAFSMVSPTVPYLTCDIYEDAELHSRLMWSTEPFSLSVCVCVCVCKVTLLFIVTMTYWQVVQKWLHSYLWI